MEKKFSMPGSLPSEALATRSTLSEKPSPIHLKGQYVRLEPLTLERDALWGSDYYTHSIIKIFAAKQ